WFAKKLIEEEKAIDEAVKTDELREPLPRSSL
ncbi:unnamed protein product, partial [marine sediment metagenome]